MLEMRTLAALATLAVPVVAFAQPVPPDVSAPPEPPGQQPQPQPQPQPSQQPGQPLQPQSPAACCAVPPPAAGPEIATKSGFMIELHLETGIVTVDEQVNTGGAPAATTLTLPAPGIFLGYRGPGVTIGVALDYSNVDATQSQSGQADNEATTSSYLIMPGIRVPVVRSTDGRSELLLQLDAGYGKISQHTTNPNPDPPDTGHTRLQIGPALRCWINSTFAVGATVGIRYDRLSQDNDTTQGLPPGSSTIATTGLFTSLQFTGVF